MPAAIPDLFRSVEDCAHVALAVSGGSDSMALACLARQHLRGRVTALTVDHGLRPESADEAQRVAGWMAGLGLDHHVLRWLGPKPASGIQAKARQARYDLMVDWCRGNGTMVLLTGHTLDDQAETVLMRMARTTSFDSLAGIPRHGHWRGFPLLRPLMGERREQLRGLLGRLGQAFIDDPSNDDPRFERVRIRRAMPILAEAGITAERLAALGQQARDASDALWGAAHSWVKQHAVSHQTGFCRLPAQAFLDQTEGLKPRILGWVISRFGGGRMAEPRELDHLTGWIDATNPGRRTLGGAIIVRRKAEILIGREPGRIDPTALPVPEDGQVVWDGRFSISAIPGSRIMAQAGTVPRRKDIPAFVQASLPMILEPDGGRKLPFIARDCDGMARFLPLNLL